ncbi:FkbM family methyltransferase [bacterium]|nr:FkbM family methyltransferase [bacterium]
MTSIIIPSFNRADLISETLDSVLNQTYRYWECIIVDDGSTDFSSEIISKYLELDNRFKYLERPKDRLKGPSACRNIGLQNAKGEYVIFLDIGTNIGITSLFLSTKENIKAIYGFEPVPYTYKIAIGNLKRNNISNVEIKNIGLGGFSRKEEFVFNSKLKGNSGLRGEASFSIRNLKEKEKTIVSVDIIDVSEEFLKIKKIHPQEKIGLKIDCEGGEYEIIDKLDLDGLLDQVNVLIIEWHDKGAEHIEDVLIKNKFKIFSRVLETNSGIIYASK